MIIDYSRSENEEQVSLTRWITDCHAHSIADRHFLPAIQLE